MANTASAGTADLVKPPLPFSFAIRHCKDPESHSRAMTGWGHAYAQVDSAPFRGSVTELLLGPLQVTAEQIDNPFGYQGGIRRGFVNFMSTMPTNSNLLCGGRSLSNEAIFRFPRNHEHNAYGNGPVKFVSASVDENVLAEYVAQCLGAEVPAAALNSALCVVEPEMVLRFRACLLDALEQGALALTGALDDTWYSKAQGRILSMLCEVVTFGLEQPRKWPAPTTRAYIVERAVEFMMADLASPPMMNDICDAVRVCPRTLRYSFEDVVGVSPNRFMLFLRLDRARRELIAAGPGACVQLVAHRNGFSNPSRFASFYQRAFGELPSGTCKRLQATAKPVSRSQSRSC